MDTTNSDDDLPPTWNYFGMAATNHEEVDALQRYPAGAANRYAAVIERQPNTPDPYSAQQAGQAARMLTQDQFTLISGQPLDFPSRATPAT